MDRFKTRSQDDKHVKYGVVKVLVFGSVILISLFSKDSPQIDTDTGDVFSALSIFGLILPIPFNWLQMLIFICAGLTIIWVISIMLSKGITRNTSLITGGALSMMITVVISLALSFPLNMTKFQTATDHVYSDSEKSSVYVIDIDVPSNQVDKFVKDVSGKHDDKDTDDNLVDLFDNGDSTSASDYTIFRIVLTNDEYHLISYNKEKSFGNVEDIIDIGEINEDQTQKLKEMVSERRL